MKVISYFIGKKTVKVSFLILVTAVLALFCNCEGVFAQSLIRTDAWVSEKGDVIEIFSFYKDGSFYSSTSNWKTGEKEYRSGYYEKSANSLILKTDEKSGGAVITCDFSWVNNNKFILKIGENKFTFCIQDRSKGFNTGAFSADPFSTPIPPPANNYNTPTKSQTCWSCAGSGACHVCNGKGTIGTVPPSPCPACHGSGRCKYCGGTGIISQ